MYFRKAFAFGKSSIPLVTCEGGDFGLYWNKSRPRRREHIVSGASSSEDLKFGTGNSGDRAGLLSEARRDSGGDVTDSLGPDENSLRQTEGELPETLSRMYRWLHLLDMAITPAMVRYAYAGNRL